jgi:TonB-dependent SusC/RagA subfamily outer membrane receptor
MKKNSAYILILILFLGCVNSPNQGNTYVKKEQKVISDGYSSQNTRDYTGSADEVKNHGNNLTLDNYLRMVAGVSVNGDGANAKVSIRGVNTFSIVTSGEPLFVIDNTVVNGGFSGVYRLINPNDISSVSVLKDASSEGLYGSRGANGVVVINLKKR